MKTGINIGMPSTLGASDAAIQASLVSPEVPSDVTIVIDANDSRAASRLNSDGTYYTITFPDDYLGGEDLFASARNGSGTKIGTGVDASANLNIIYNIPLGMNIGANVAENIISDQSSSFWGMSWSRSHKVSDPCIYLKLDTNNWSEDILENSRLNITVNNYGWVIGAGGSGGYGGAIVDGKSPNLTYKAGDGGGGGQGGHPSWGTSIPDYSLDRNDTAPFEAGQGGLGYNADGQHNGGGGANGAQGTAYTGGLHGTSSHPDSESGLQQHAGHGHVGGTVIYIDSDTTVSGSRFVLDVYNAGWMSGGAGGGGGGYSLIGGRGGSFGVMGKMTEVSSTDTGIGSGTGGRGAFGGYPGWSGSVIWRNLYTNLSVSNTITNVSGNTIYGWDGSW